jgi:hypothetical protein
MVGGASAGHFRGARLVDTVRLLDELSPLVAHPRGSDPGPAPTADGITVLAEDPYVSTEVVASDTTVYWVDRGLSSVDSIVAVPLAGGLATTLYACPGDGVDAIPSLALDSGYLYWVESTVEGPETSFVKRMRIGGVAVEPVLTQRPKIKQIAVQGGFVYSLGETELRVTRLSDGDETILGAVPASSEGPALTVDGPSAFWLGAPHRFTRAIMTATSPLFQSVTLFAREAAVTAMRVEGSSVYWIEYGGGKSGSSVFAMDGAGGAPERVFESARLNASTSYGHALLAADAEGAYWMVDGSGPRNDGAIYGGAPGMTPRVVVSGIGGSGGLASCGDWLVFTDMGEGLVVRARK